MEVYSFNKGHAVGYAMVGFQLMWYKVYYPIQFWYTVMKYAETDDMLMKYKLDAVKQGNVVMLPHVNRSKAQYSIAKYDGEYCLQEGLVNIKKVGEKAALHIEQERAKNGIFKDFDDFYDRCKMKGSPVNKGVIEALKEHGALEFKKSVYISRTVKYNSALYLKGLR
jgi:DNA polymerase-3 subunit alpha